MQFTELEINVPRVSVFKHSYSLECIEKTHIVFKTYHSNFTVIKDALFNT